MNTEQNPSPIAGGKERARKFALIALALWLLHGIPITIALVLKFKLLLTLVVLFMHWCFPFIVAFGLEKRGVASLGFSFKQEDTGKYLLYSVVGFAVIAGIILGERFLRIYLAGESPEAWDVSRSFLQSLGIQILMVGLPEEILYRGFLMTRLCDWLGRTRGLIYTALIFGIVHSFSRLLWQGGDYVVSATINGCASCLAGLVLGFQYLKTRSLVPSAVTHILMSPVLGQIFSRWP